MARVLFLQQMLPQEMLGILALSRALKKAGHETRCVLVPDRDWIARIREYDPHVVGIGTVTGPHARYLEMLRPLRKTVDRAMVVMGGPHPTFVPDILKEPGLDAICCGEGDGAIVELCDRLDRGEPYLDVRNFHFKKTDGEVVTNPLRPLVQDLDSLGFPDREMLYDASPFYRNLERKIFLSHRGCPYICSFCFHHAWRDKVYHATRREYLRKRSVEHLLAELEWVRESWPLRFVHFLDDIFNVDDAWLDEFCERYPRRIGIPFDVILRTNLTSDRHMKKLRAAGCVSARLAFETANDFLRNQVYRKLTKLEEMENAARFVKTNGMRLTTLNIVGAPGSTMEDDLETLRLNVRAKVDHPLVSLLQPYPMTDVNEMMKTMGFTTDAYDRFPEKFNRTSSIHLDHRAEVENLHKLFPIVVRHPRLLRLVPRMVRWHLLRRLYLAAYLIYTEYLASEQLRLCKVAQGRATFRSRPLVDCATRVAKKTFLKVQESVFGRVSVRMRIALASGDERTIAHADG
jgi:radical SAM superfamily enzyme YgiQ (UPF0313 family)